MSDLNISGGRDNIQEKIADAGTHDLLGITALNIRQIKLFIALMKT
jgi:hypothetical protein